MSISLLQARKILGKGSDKLSDPELQTLLNQLFGISEIIAELLIEKHVSKNQPMGVDAPNEGRENNHE